MGKLEELKDALDKGITNEKLLSSLPAEFDLSVYKFYFQAAVVLDNKDLIVKLLEKVPTEYSGVFDQLCFDALYDQLIRSDISWLSILATHGSIHLRDNLTGNTLLHAAVLGDQSQAIAYLRTGIDQSLTNLQKETAFELACRDKRFYVMKALLNDKKFTKHYQRQSRRAMPLLGVNLTQYTDELSNILNLMISRGVNLQEQDEIGDTFLHKIAKSKMPIPSQDLKTSLKKIIAMSDLSIKNIAGFTPLQIALGSNIFQVLFDVLTEQQPQLDLSELLERALECGIPTAKKILEYDSTACWQYDDGGNRALQIAVKQRSTLAIEMLLSHGANGDMRNLNGKKIFEEHVFKYEFNHYWLNEVSRSFESCREKTFFFWDKKSLEDKYFEQQQKINKLFSETSPNETKLDSLRVILAEYRDFLSEVLASIPTRIELLRKNKKIQTHVIMQYHELENLIKILVDEVKNLPYKKDVDKISLPEIRYIKTYLRLIRHLGYLNKAKKSLPNFQPEKELKPLIQIKPEWRPILPPLQEVQPDSSSTQPQPNLYPTLDMLLGKTENTFCTSGLLMKALVESPSQKNEPLLIDFDSFPEPIATSIRTQAEPILLVPTVSQESMKDSSQQKSFFIPKAFQIKFEAEEAKEKKEYQEFQALLHSRETQQETWQALSLLPSPPPYRPKQNDSKPAEEKKMQFA